MMRSLPSPKLLATGGAVVVASVAYAIGSQTGGGTAGAATKAAQPAALSTVSGTTGAQGRVRGPGHRPGHGRFGGPGLDGLLGDAAQALGVSEAKLRTALEELRTTLPKRDDRRGDLAASLAKSLGLDTAKVTAALDAQRPDRGDRFGALAKSLGLSTAKVEAAFRAVKPERRAQRGSQDGRDAFLTALAKELGVTNEKLTTALGTTGGPGFGGRGPDGHGPGSLGHGPGGRHGGPADTAALAKALGVEEAKLTAALTTFRTEQRRELDGLRDDLVKQLAAKLGVPEAKVAEVADRFLPGGRRP